MRDELAPRKLSWIDPTGIIASTSCALHCALSALLPGLFATLGLTALLGHEAEWMFTIIAIFFASAAALVGWRRHRSGMTSLLLGLGVLGLLGSRHLEESALATFGPGLSVCAGALLVLGHLYNVKAYKRSASASSMA